MKANSNDNPGIFTHSRGKLFFNFNIVEAEKTEEDGSTRVVFDYEYIEVRSKDHGDIIEGVIRDKYSMSDEIALINNNADGTAAHLAEYQAYLGFRQSVKGLTKESLAANLCRHTPHLTLHTSMRVLLP